MANNELTTQPTIQTILERIEGLKVTIEQRFDALDVRLDPMESEVKQTHSELFTLRADFRELRASLKEHFQFVK